MTKTTHPLSPREITDACRDLLGDTYLTKLFGITRRSLQRWTAKTPYVSEESIRENFIEKHEKLLHRLMKDLGGMEIARSLVSRYADIVDCDLVSKTIANPDKTTIEEECLDDYPPITHVHNGIRQKKPLPAIRDLAAKAKIEIDETVNLYAIQCEDTDEF